MYVLISLLPKIPSGVDIVCDYTESTESHAIHVCDLSFLILNEVAVRGPRRTPPPSPQTALKWCATQRPRLSPFMSVTARRSERTCDDTVVSEYGED